MAGSAYYYGEYLRHLALAEKYDNWMDYIVSVKKKLAEDFTDNVQSVNEKISNLHEDLSSSVRYNSTYNNNINIFYSRKEKDVGSDSVLSGVHSALNDEVTSLQGRRDTEQRAAENAHRLYKEALAREWEAAKNALTGS